jgi:hypothetical protein
LSNLSSSFKSKSKFRYDRRSVGQSVLVSSPMLRTVRQLRFCQSGALSDERSGLSFVIVFVSLLSIVNRWYIQLLTVKKYIYIYTIYTWPLSVQAENSRSCPTTSSSGYNGSLVTCHRQV